MARLDRSSAAGVAYGSAALAKARMSEPLRFVFRIGG